MKKAGLFVIALLLFSIVFASFAYADEQIPSGSEQIEEQFGVNPENIPTSQEELKEKYLVKEWSSIISGLPVLGPVHNFLVDNPLLFKILFNYPYEFSATFFLIIFLWLVISFKSAKILKSSGILKGVYPLLTAFAFTIVLAHINLFNFIASGVTTFMFARDAWWARALIFTIACALIIGFSILADYISKALKQQAALKEKGEMKQGIAESQALTEGLRKGQELTK